MSQQSHDVPAVDHRCTSYRPGHQVHFIHARKSSEDEAAVDVLALVRPDGLIRLESAGEVVVCWHHDVRRLAAALRRTGGFARWRPRRHALAVPTAPGRDHLFNLAAPQQATVCGAPRVTPSAARRPAVGVGAEIDAEGDLPRVPAIETVPPGLLPGNPWSGAGDLALE